MPAKGAARPRLTAAEKAASKDAEIAALRRQLADQPAALPTSPPVNGNGPASTVPVIDLDDDDEPEPLKRVPLFRADGKEYLMVVNPPQHWGFEALALAGGADGLGSEAGMAASQVFILRSILGVDGLRALRNCKSIKPAKLRQIMAICSQTVYGAMEPPKTS